MKKNVILLSLVFFVNACSSYSTINSIDMASNDKFSIEEAEKSFKNGDYKKAADIYKQISTYEETEYNLFAYAESLRLSGDCVKAIEVYQQVLQSNPNALHAIEGKSLCYVKQGNLQDAAESLSYVLQKDTSKWRTINALGVIYSLNGHMDESMEYYNMAIEENGHNPTVLNNIGLSLAFSGDYERGKTILEKSIDLVPKSDKIKRQKIELNLALIYGLAGEMEKSKHILGKHLSEEKVMNNLGFYAKLAGDDKLAKSYLRESLSSSAIHYEKAWNNLQSLDTKG